MKGPEFRTIREALELDRDEFGQLLGYTGTRKTVKSMVARMEMNRREISPTIARLAWLILEAWKQSGIPVFPPSCDAEPGWVRAKAEEPADAEHPIG